MYKHILLTTDLTDESIFIIKHALDLAKRYNAKLSMMHVVESLPAYSYFGANELEGEYIEQAELELARFGEEFGVAEEDQYVEVGSTKGLVLSVAKELEVDLIIVGSRSHHGIELLLGSTANAIVHAAHCDVLTVRVPDRDYATSDS